MSNKMVAYQGDPAIKAKYLDRVRSHREADEITKGVYWERGEGCAVGCTIHGPDHRKYQTELGIPVALAYFQDTLFEGLPLEDAVIFPEQFLGAITVGADLSRVESQFFHWLLTNEQIGLPRIADDRGKAALATVAKLWRSRLNGDGPEPQEWLRAKVEAAAAARAAAWDAARDAARAAVWAAAMVAARAAVVDAVGAAARAAAWDAAGAAAAWDTAAAYRAMAVRLVELVREAS
jgi:hypothetical protein